MMLITNYEGLGAFDGREVIRCRRCRLVQFRPLMVCRRCYVVLDQWVPEPAPPPAPVSRKPGGPRLDFGLAIRFWREVYQLSQRELGRRLGTTRQYLSKLENHHVEPVLDTCCRCADALGIPLRLLVLTAEGLPMRQVEK